MANSVLRLYPAPTAQITLERLYLDRPLLAHAQISKPLIYANFISSLDGRIALWSTQKKRYTLPDRLVHPNDFRLFLELHAHADCLVTHAGYLRAVRKKELGNILQLPADKKYRDIADWRISKKLTNHPDIIIVSSSLDFPVPTTLVSDEQKLIVVTTKNSPKNKRETLEKFGCEVLVTRNTNIVQGKELIRAITKYNYRAIYLVAGPQLMRTMIHDQLLNKLFFTTSHQLIGGETFKTITEGPEIFNHCSLKLKQLFYDEKNKGHSHWFVEFDCVYS